jgi:hypothetical protein
MKQIDTLVNTTGSYETHITVRDVISLISGGIDPVKPRLFRVLLSHDANFHSVCHNACEQADRLLHILRVTLHSSVR